MDWQRDAEQPVPQALALGQIRPTRGELLSWLDSPLPGVAGAAGAGATLHLSGFCCVQANRGPLNLSLDAREFLASALHSRL